MESQRISCHKARLLFSVLTQAFDHTVTIVYINYSKSFSAKHFDASSDTRALCERLQPSSLYEWKMIPGLVSDL